MVEVKPNEIKLKVAEAIQDDVGKGIVRIDSQLMKDIVIQQGSIVEIAGSKKTVAIAGRAFPADIGLSIIRMDGLARKNAGTSIGEYVVIKRADVKPAKSVTIAPAQKGIIIQMNPASFKRALLGRAVIKGDLVSLGGTRRRRATFSGSPFEDIFRMIEEDFNYGMFPDLKFVVISTGPKDAVMITEDTEIEMHPEAVELKEEQKVPDVAYEDIGGLQEEVHKVREMIELPLKHPEIFERLGIQAPKGVLLYGPPGTGKTLIARAVVNETDAYCVSISGPEVMGKFYGESEARLRGVFEDAQKHTPAIIFIDEIDAIAPKREEMGGEKQVERRVVAQLLSLLDGLESRGQIIVIGATNIPNTLDSALRRPGRFDREISIPIPDKNGRLEILQIHTRGMPLLKDVSLEKLAEITHGFVGADLAALCREAAMSALRKILPKIDFEVAEIPYETLLKLEVTMDNFLEALKEVEPSAIREVFVEVPDVKWEDAGGLDNIKEELKEAVEWPLKYADVFKKAGTNPPKGILLYGEPGTGKTLLAKAVAHESGVNFISIKGPQRISQYVGESERGVREIFKKAKQAAPTILFLDEVDSLVPKRGSSSTDAHVTERVISQFLTEMDGIEELKGVVVLAATNRLDLIDPALLRSGRFDLLLELPRPDARARLEIFRIHSRQKPLEKDIDLRDLAKRTEGKTGSDIEFICRRATMLAIREFIGSGNKTEGPVIGLKHFEDALVLAENQTGAIKK